MERATTNGKLFDLLEGVPAEYPIIWDDKEKVWKKTDNLLQALIKGEEKNG